MEFQIKSKVKSQNPKADVLVSARIDFSFAGEKQTLPALRKRE
jgi:hypothetical protein